MAQEPRLRCEDRTSHPPSPPQAPGSSRAQKQQRQFPLTPAVLLVKVVVHAPPHPRPPGKLLTSSGQPHSNQPRPDPHKQGSRVGRLTAATSVSTTQSGPACWAPGLHPHCWPAAAALGAWPRDGSCPHRVQTGQCLCRTEPTLPGAPQPKQGHTSC